MPSVTRSPIDAAVSTTAPAARFTRATGLLLEPSELAPPPPPRLADDRFADARFADARFGDDRFADARLAEDFFAEDFFAEDFLAEDFFAVERFADDFFADDFRAEDFFADDFFADARFAEDFFADERLADDFLADERFADDFFAPPLRALLLRAPPVLEVAAAPEVRMLRRAVPLFLLRDDDLRVDVPPEDFERVAMSLLLVEEVCLAGTQELGTQRHQRNGSARNSRHFDDYLRAARRVRRRGAAAEPRAQSIRRVSPSAGIHSRAASGPPPITIKKK
jgi:hypothetical protein